MTITALAVCERTWQRLGPDGLAELAACLWPVDCQSCGRLLGDEPPAVVVDELGLVAVASLHHHRCRQPGWNDSIVVVAGSGQYTTFVARMMLLPLIADNGTRVACPLMLVNPGLESVQLRRGRDGHWQVGHGLWLGGSGLFEPGRPLRVGVPSGGVMARATGSSVAVVFQVPPFTVYEAPADGSILDRVRALGGVLVVVTSALNPGDFAVSDLAAAFEEPWTTAVWAGLHGTHRQRRRRFRLRSEIWVLHWNSEQLSVGTLIWQASGRLSTERARRWAERAVSDGQYGSLAWQPVRDGHADAGWQACGSSGDEHVLRRHADGWKLVLVCGQDAGARAESDNEAKAWAADQLNVQAGVSGLTWRPASSVPGSLTWYGIAR